MLLVVVFLAVILLCTFLATARGRVREVIRLSLDLLDLVTLLVVLRLKASRVRDVDW